MGPVSAMNIEAKILPNMLWLRLNIREFKLIMLHLSYDQIRMFYVALTTKKLLFLAV